MNNKLGDQESKPGIQDNEEFDNGSLMMIRKNLEAALKELKLGELKNDNEF
jgi:hypothetical protein